MEWSGVEWRTLIVYRVLCDQTVTNKRTIGGPCDEEVKLMEVRIGVVRNTLLQVSLKKKDAKKENKKPANDEDDYSDGDF